MSNTKRMASNINIKWNPTTDDGDVRFDFNSYLLDSENNPTDFIDPDRRHTVNETIQEIAQRQIVTAGTFTDPITQEPLPHMSGAGLMILIKATVDQIRNELENEILVRDNSPSSSQTEMTITPTSLPADGTTEAEIIVQLKTKDGSLITWGGYDVTFETDLGELIGEIVDNGDGTYTQNIRSSTVGTAEIKAATDGGADAIATGTIVFTEVV